MKKRVFILICFIFLCLTTLFACDTDAKQNDGTSNIISPPNITLPDNEEDEEKNEDFDAPSDAPFDDGILSENSPATGETPSNTENLTPPPADTEGGTDTKADTDSDTTADGNEGANTEEGVNTAPNKENQTPKSIKVISLTSPVAPNNTATIEIQGLKDTEYSIKVYYSSGASTAKGLENKVSDESGIVSWSWKVGGRTKSGKYKIVIQGGDEKLEVYFEVAE